MKSGIAGFRPCFVQIYELVERVSQLPIHFQISRYFVLVSYNNNYIILKYRIGLHCADIRIKICIIPSHPYGCTAGGGPPEIVNIQNT